MDHIHGSYRRTPQNQGTIARTIQVTGAVLRQHKFFLLWEKNEEGHTCKKNRHVVERVQSNNSNLLRCRGFRRPRDRWGQDMGCVPRHGALSRNPVCFQSTQQCSKTRVGQLRVGRCHPEELGALRRCLYQGPRAMGCLIIAP